MSDNKKVLEVEMLCSAMKSLCEAIDLLTEKRIGMEIKLEQLESKVECLELISIFIQVLMITSSWLMEI